MTKQRSEIASLSVSATDCVDDAHVSACRNLRHRGRDLCSWQRSDHYRAAHADCTHHCRCDESASDFARDDGDDDDGGDLRVANASVIESVSACVVMPFHRFSTRRLLRCHFQCRWPEEAAAARWRTCARTRGASSRRGVAESRRPPPRSRRPSCHCSHCFCRRRRRRHRCHT